MEILELGAGVLLASASDHERIAESLSHRGHSYRRFMDRLFLPCSTEELSIDQIKVVNRFREATFQSDAQFNLNVSVKRRVGAALDVLGCRSILEIGCGKFPIIDFVSGAERYTCVEVDDEAISTNRATCIDCISLESLISDSTRSNFDVFVSLFVFQFNVAPALTEILHKRSCNHGIGIVNLHGVEPALRAKRIQMLIESGFYVTTIPDAHPGLRKNEFLILSKAPGHQQDHGRIECIRQALLAVTA